MKLNNANYSCNQTNWMFNREYWWTLSTDSVSAFGVTTSGSFFSNGVSGEASIRPALYLNSKIKIEGTGTESDPYTIE